MTTQTKPASMPASRWQFRGNGEWPQRWIGLYADTLILEKDGTSLKEIALTSVKYAPIISKSPEMAELLESFLVYLREFWPDEPLFSADQNTQAEVIAKAERLLAEIGGQV